MYRVVYVSTATQILTSSELAELADRWKARNGLVGITGVCLYIGGNFMQAFEGEDDNARALFNRIKSDQLHRSLVTIVEEDAVEERLFGDWSLDFREAADIPKPNLGGLRSFIDDALSGQVPDRSGVAMNLLVTLVKAMHPHDNAHHGKTARE